MNHRNARFFRCGYGKQGPRPRDIDRVNAHVQRKRVRAALRGYRYLRLPQLDALDFAVGAASGFGVLAAAMLVAGWWV